MRNLSLRQLRAVLAAHRLGKINLVAREIGLSPSAVTLQIQQAEAAAGAILFDRTSEGLRATDSGHVFVAAAQAIEQRLAMLRDELALIQGVGGGTLRLGAVSTAKYFVPLLMAGFLADYPGVDIRLTVGNRAAMVSALHDQEIDIVLMGRPPRTMPVSTYLIGEHPLVIIAPPDHPLASLTQISKRSIAEEHFLVREPGSGTRMSLELFLGDIPGRLDSIGAEFGSNETIKQAVMAGLGIAFISAHTIALEVSLGRLVILDVLGTPVRRHWFTVSRADRTFSSAMTAFNAFVRQRGVEFLPVVQRIARQQTPAPADR